MSEGSDGNSLPHVETARQGVSAPASIKHSASASSSNSSSQGGGGPIETWPHLSGQLRGDTHVLPIRVYYEDTDFSGFAYHGSYIRFLERGRTELLRALDVDQSDLHAEENFAFVVRQMILDYLKPAQMDDELTVSTRVIEMRGATMRLAQSVARRGDILVTAEVTVAATRNGRAARIPDFLRTAMAPQA